MSVTCLSAVLVRGLPTGHAWMRGCLKHAYRCSCKHSLLQNRLALAVKRRTGWNPDGLVSWVVADFRTFKVRDEITCRKAGLIAQLIPT